MKLVIYTINIMVPKASFKGAMALPGTIVSVTFCAKQIQTFVFLYRHSGNACPPAPFVTKLAFDIPVRD